MGSQHSGSANRPRTGPLDNLIELQAEADFADDSMEYEWHILSSLVVSVQCQADAGGLF